MIPTIQHSGEGKSMETVKKKLVVAIGAGWIGRAQWTFLSSENILYDSMMMCYVIVHLSKSTEYIPIRVNPNVNYVLG